MGAGTTGLVFRAHDPVEGRLVAIKAFRLDLTPERVAELARALEVLPGRGLSHPSIAAPIAAGVEDGIAWFAQAYVPAESLDSALRQYGPPPVADVLTIVTQLAGALDFAAAAGVLHGSLHPRDVLVAPGETHVLDLGVSAALESCGVRAPVRRPYSAPERSAGRPISRAGDIFALGAIAFELLSGQPVTGSGDDVVAALPDVPGANRDALLETFSFALALAPDERYATALAFAAPLKRALGDALTRPAAPRKRRTTRPTSLLPIDEPEPESLPGPAEDAGSAIEPTLILPARDRTGDSGPASAHAESVRSDAPAYVSGPTEPEPPAIEPIAAPGEANPPAPPPPASRFSSLDERDALSPLDAALLSDPADPLDRWDVPARVRSDEFSRPPDGDAGGDIVRRYAVDDEPDYSLGDSPAYGADRVDVHDAPAGDERTGGYATARDEESALSRAPWLTLAAMLFVGLVAGLAGGWLLFSGDRAGPAASSATSPASGTADAGGARPREFTDDAVRQPDGTSTGAATRPAAPPASRPAAAPRATTPPPAAAPPAAAAARGRLVIRTRPAGARVEIGGRSRGESPVTLTDVAYGQHTVRVSRSGYVTEQRRVTLSSRRPAQSVDVTLKRTPPPAAPARAARQPAGGFVGTLVVESRPVGAKVFLDGRGVGVTPLSLPGVSVGSHVVRLDLAGYRRWSTSIRVVAGERERVAASLEEETPP